MNIHEYQAKQLLAKYGVAVARGVAYTRRKPSPAPRRRPGRVVKAQIHAGGRGKASGVKVVSRWRMSAKPQTDELTLVTHQTGGRQGGEARLYRGRLLHCPRIVFRDAD